MFTRIRTDAIFCGCHQPFQLLSARRRITFAFIPRADIYYGYARVFQHLVVKLHLRHRLSWLSPKRAANAWLLEEPKKFTHNTQRGRKFFNSSRRGDLFCNIGALSNARSFSLSVSCARSYLFICESVELLADGG
jgi:hypothetical protein